MDANTFGLMSAGFANALMPSNLIMMIIGVTIGIVVGCMPGLSAAMGVALLLPLTFGMAPETGLIMLGGIYCGAIFGGSISAILIHTPGTPASAATALDGYELTKQGKAGKALGTACIASFFGGLLSCISLYFFAPMLAELAMKFGSPEYFWLALFGLTIIAGVTTGSMVKGLMSGAFGLILSTVGMDPRKARNGSCSASTNCTTVSTSPVPSSVSFPFPRSSFSQKKRLRKEEASSNFTTPSC